ncbi:unnamed protein product [Caenorhabditis brenneri]
MSSDESETSETSTELLDIDVDFPTWKFLQTINSIEELTKMCDEYAKQKALPEIIEIMERIAEIQLVKNEDKPLDIVARNMFVNVLIPVFKYNNISNMYEAREISDLVHFYIYNEMRKHPFHQSFATSRALLTPHRRRQLAKTMNEDSRVFAYGLNSYHSLGDPMEEDFFYFAVPTEIKIPPVYEMRVSTHHSIFWLHDGRFFGCGDGRKFLMQLSSKQRPVLYKEPVQIDLVIRPGETITGFRTLEYGTLFETEKSWYFVGDYSKSCHYLQSLNSSAKFRMIKNLQPPSDNYWVAEDPQLRITGNVQLLDDAKKLIELRILNKTYMIKIFPGYWTEFNVGHVKRRPVCFLFDGVEKNNILLEHVGSSNNVIWVIHDFVLYHGIMTPMLKEGHTDDERDLDNYILLIDFTEFRTPTPYQVTGIASSRSSGVLIKCGDYPNEYYDHMQLAELRYRGNVHKLMFESIDAYRTVCRTSDIYTGSGKNEETPLTIDLVLEELDQIANNEQLGAELKSDWCGRIEKKDRYCNFFSFLGYISMPRLPGRPPKCFDTDIDSMVDIENAEYVARYRVRQLFEEFERVNYPGTDVWKPTEFLKEYPEPEDDTVSEGHYRAAAMRWALRTFGANMRTYNKSAMYKKDDKKTQIVIHYILNIVWYGTDLYYITNGPNPPPRRDKLNLFHKAIENIMPDDELIFASSNPGLVFDNRKKDGVVRDEDLDEPMNILVTYKMRHQTKNYVATRFKVMTCFSFLASQNPHLLLFVKNNVVDLNSVYPDDIRIQRLVVQTHFIGHGYTDIDDFFVTNEACNEIFTTAGYQLEIQQTYLKRGITHRRGNLVQTPKTPTCHIATTVKPEDYVTNNIEIETSDGITVYCHRQLKTVYSSLPLDDPLPNTLPCDLMLPALNGILDRMIYDDLPLRARIEIVAWYAEAKMHEAFIDLLKQCVMDVRQEDFKDFRILVEAYPTQMQRLIAQYRPGMIFWNHSPIPRPRVQHLKIILEMFPKNEYGRHTRVPRKHIINKKDEAEKSVFRQISTRELRRYYMTERERKHQDYDISLFEKDFPLPYTFKPFKSTSKTKDYGEIKEGLYAPPVPLRRKTVALIAASERELEALPEQKSAQWYKPDPLSKRLENMFEEVTISEERENGDRMQQRLIGGKKNRRK